MLLLNTSASVSKCGAVLLGKYVACDAFDETKPIRIVTHAHADHLVGLRQSLRTCEESLMTRATKDLINVLRGPLLLGQGHVQTVDYGRPIQHDDERITFLRADHILGAAQVLVEDAENRIVFTGDFRVGKTPIIDADVLVIEATYGSPACRRQFCADIKNLLVSKVEEGLACGTVHIFGYHGKLQEVMEILNSAHVNAPFVASEKIFRFSKACKSHGMQIGKLLSSEEDEAKEMTVRNSPVVAFHHMNTKAKANLRGFRILLSGWEFGMPTRQTGENEYVVALSGHSDFFGLLEYVKTSKPKLVITDNYRGGHAERFAKEVSKRFGILAYALPK